MGGKMKYLAILVALGFFAGSVRGDDPKSYRLTLSTVSKIGGQELQPGEYKLLVDTQNPKVRFTEVKTGNEIELEAKVETVSEKIATTMIRSANGGEVRRIIEIRLGGSKTRVLFE